MSNFAFVSTDSRLLSNVCPYSRHFLQLICLSYYSWSSAFGRYPGKTRYHRVFFKLSKRGWDVAFLVLIQVAFCTSNKLNSLISCSMYSEMSVVLILLDVDHVFWFISSLGYNDTWTVCLYSGLFSSVIVRRVLLPLLREISMTSSESLSYFSFRLSEALFCWSWFEVICFCLCVFYIWSEMGSLNYCFWEIHHFLLGQADLFSSLLQSWLSLIFITLSFFFCTSWAVLPAMSPSQWSAVW